MTTQSLNPVGNVVDGGADPARSAAAQATPRSRSRISAIDMMRGLVMLTMLIDHVREGFYLHMQVSDPMNLGTTATDVFLRA